MAKIICGIQQIGIGVPDVVAGFDWYRKTFDMDIPVFDDAGTAALMLPYTDNKPHERRAILSINMQGGGGFEIWQYTSRTPQPANFDIQLGDLGTTVAKIKAKSARAAYVALKIRKVNVISEIMKNPAGVPHFFVKDPFDNIFEIVEDNVWYTDRKTAMTGGPIGVMIGVSDIEKSKEFYKQLLGYDTVVYQQEGVFEDLKAINGGDKKFKRALLTHSEQRKGPFSEMFGTTYIELVEAVDYTPRKIFENRLWGDLGYIHLCFDIIDMQSLKEECEKLGHPFTVDSAEKFDMGAAAGHFSYIEDPDGTLIEFVETFKIPILKKVGLFLDLTKRDRTKALPKFMVKSLGMNRVK